MMYFSVLSKKKKTQVGWSKERWKLLKFITKTPEDLVLCSFCQRSRSLFVTFNFFNNKNFWNFFSFLEVINFRSDGMTSLVWIKFFWFFVFCDPYKLTPETIYIDSSDSLACRRYRWGDEKGRKWIWQFRWRPQDQQDGFWDKQDIQWKTGNHGTNSRRGCQHKR